MPLSIKSGMSPLFLARSAEVVLGIALALALADFAGLLLPGHGDKEPPAFAPDVQDVPARTTATASAGKGTSRHLSPAVLGLFGQRENAAPVLVDDTIKETALDLRLKGILVRRGTARQVALIAQGDDEETVYRLGDRIAGAEITHIETRRVVLLRNGRREALLLETDEPRRGSSFRK